VSPRVMRALRRGLRHDLDARWPSMTALIAELSPRSRAAYVSAGAGAFGIAGAVALTFALASGDPGASCAHAADRLARSWTTATRDALVAGLRSVPADANRTSTDRIVELLDARAARWRTVAIGTCQAKQARTEPADLTRRRTDCLERSAVAFEAAVGRLQQVASAAELPVAAAVARGGLDAEECGTADVAARVARVASPALVQRVAALQLAALADGDVSDGQRLVTELEAVGDQELLAEVWWVIARDVRNSSAATQRSATRKAAEAASTVGRHAMAAAAWARAASIAAELGDLRTVDDLLAMATSAAALSKSDDAARRVEVARASVALERNDVATAERLARAVIVATEGQPLDDAREAAFEVLTDTFVHSRQWVALEEVTQRHELLATERWGSNSDIGLQARARRAIARWQQGDHEGGRGLRAEAIRVLTARDPDSMLLLRTLQDTARDESEGGNVWPPEAEAVLAQAVALVRRALPVDDVQRARVMGLEAARHAAAGRVEEAHAAWAESLAALEKQDDINEWALYAQNEAMFDQANEQCPRAIERLRQITIRGRDGAIRPALVAMSKCLLGSCQTLTDADVGIATMLEGIAELKAANQQPVAADCELTAAEVELKRGHRAQGRALAIGVRQRFTGEGGLDSYLRDKANAILAKY